MWWCVKVCGPRVMGEKAQGRTRRHTCTRWPVPGGLQTQGLEEGPPGQSHDSSATVLMGAFDPTTHHSCCAPVNTRQVFCQQHARQASQPLVSGAAQQASSPPTSRSAHATCCAAHIHAHTPPPSCPRALHRTCCAAHIHASVCICKHTHPPHCPTALHCTCHVAHIHAHTHIPSTAPAMLRAHTPYTQPHSPTALYCTCHAARTHPTHTPHCPTTLHHTAIRLTLTTMPSRGPSVYSKT